MTTITNTYRSEIDGLRFIAITTVIFFHVGFADWSGGFTGVDIFFVLSGYLICGQIYLSLLTNTFSTLDFFARRIRRLSTAAFACFFATGVTSYFMFGAFELGTVSKNLVGAIYFVNNFFLMSDVGYFSTTADNNPFLHTWSLSIEEQFYIFIPLLIVILRLRSKSFVYLLSIALFVSLSLALFSDSRIYSPDARYFSSLLRIWELALGGLCFVWLHKRQKPLHRPALPLLGLGAMIAPTFIIDESTLHPGPAALVVASGTAIMLLLAFPSGSLTARALANRSLAYLGKISYGTYLWHWPAIVFYQYAWDDFNDKSRFVLILFSFGMGALSHHLLEKPISAISVTHRRNLLFKVFALQTLLLTGLSGAIWWRSQNAAPEDYVRYSEILEQSGFGTGDWASCWGAPITETCRFGVNVSEANHIVLWGDSMAFSAISAFDEFARENGQSGIAYSTPSCAPVLGIVRNTDGATTCRAVNDHVYGMLQSAPPTDVFLFARWPHYAEGVRSNMWGDGGLVEFIDAEDNIVASNTATALGDALAALLAAMPDRHRVVVIGAPPEFPFSVPAEMIRSIRLERPQPEFLRSSHDTRAGDTTEMLRSVTQLERTVYLDLSEVFCDADICQFQEDGIPLFSDHVHLSLKGNEVLLNALRSASIQSGFAPQTSDAP